MHSSTFTLFPVIWCLQTSLQKLAEPCNILATSNERHIPSLLLHIAKTKCLHLSEPQNGTPMIIVLSISAAKPNCSTRTVLHVFASSCSKLTKISALSSQCRLDGFPTFKVDMLAYQKLCNFDYALRNLLCWNGFFLASLLSFCHS